MIKASALYFGGNFEHALVSFYRAKKTCTGQVDNNNILEGIKNAENAITNALAKSDSEAYANIKKVMKSIPDLMNIPWFAIKQSVDDINKPEVNKNSLASILNKDVVKRDPKAICKDGIFLKNIMHRMEKHKMLTEEREWHTYDGITSYSGEYCVT